MKSLSAAKPKKADDDEDSPGYFEGECFGIQLVLLLLVIIVTIINLSVTVIPTIMSHKAYSKRYSWDYSKDFLHATSLSHLRVDFFSEPRAAQESEDEKKFEEGTTLGFGAVQG